MEIETDEDYNNFMTYIKTQDYSYKSNIEIELEKLKILFSKKIF